MAKVEKTNVMRILDQKKINYKSYEYSDTEAISGVEVAEVLGENPNQVFKTLVTVGATKANYVFMIPVHKELDLKKAAKAVKNWANERVDDWKTGIVMLKESGGAGKFDMHSKQKLTNDLIVCM